MRPVTQWTVLCVLFAACQDDCKEPLEPWGPVLEAMAQCSDGIQNGDERCVDGGGVCEEAFEQVCAPTCDDGIRNQGELSADCGGPCQDCTCSGDTPSNANDIAVLAEDAFGCGWLLPAYANNLSEAMACVDDQSGFSSVSQLCNFDLIYQTQPTITRTIVAETLDDAISCGLWTVCWNCYWYPEDYPRDHNGWGCESQ